MHKRTEAAARFLIRISLGLFTGVVLLLAQSIFWNNAISGSARALLSGVALLSFFRPRHGLLGVTALAPLALVWMPLLGSRMRGSEAMVLAFLSGALMRGWTLGRFRPSRQIDFRPPPPCSASSLPLHAWSSFGSRNCSWTIQGRF